MNQIVQNRPSLSQIHCLLVAVKESDCHEMYCESLAVFYDYVHFVLRSFHSEHLFCLGKSGSGKKVAVEVHGTVAGEFKKMFIELYD